jgi:hypothetical protein
MDSLQKEVMEEPDVRIKRRIEPTRKFQLKKKAGPFEPEPTRDITPKPLDTNIVYTSTTYQSKQGVSTIP